MTHVKIVRPTLFSAVIIGARTTAMGFCSKGEKDTAQFRIRQRKVWIYSHGTRFRGGRQQIKNY